MYEPMEVWIIEDIFNYKLATTDDPEGFDDYFSDENAEIRVWKTPGYAKGLLKRAVSSGKYGRNLAFKVHNLDGSITAISYDESEDPNQKYGPHDWRKKNLVTKIDSTGSYDLWKCTYCGLELKVYGLGGPVEGQCKKNPILEGEVNG